MCALDNDLLSQDRIASVFNSVYAPQSVLELSVCSDVDVPSILSCSVSMAFTCWEFSYSKRKDKFSSEGWSLHKTKAPYRTYTQYVAWVQATNFMI